MESGCIQTVLGSITPEQLGITLPHEHLSMSMEFVRLPLTSAEDEEKGGMPFTLKNIGWINQNPYKHLPNLKLYDCKGAIIEDLHQFKTVGGSSLVENSTEGLGRDIKAIKKMSEDTGVNIIAGAGYYVAQSRGPQMNAVSVEDLENALIKELTVGSQGTDIKCGSIGELGCSSPLHANERKVLQAAAGAHLILGCGVNIHPGRGPGATFEALRIFQEAGGNASKLAMSHMDRSIFETGELLDFAKLGCYIEYDLFGIEASNYTLADIDMPSDAQRINNIKLLVDSGFEDKVLLSHDIHTKHRLTAYGGHGFIHIQRNVVPKMLRRGITQHQIDKFLVNNPRQWLFVK